MKINAIDIKPGNVLEHSGKLWLVLQVASWCSPARAAPSPRSRCATCAAATRLNERFRTQETVERVRLDEKEMQFLYFDGDDGDLHGQRELRAAHRRQRADRRARRTSCSEGMVCTIQLYEGDAALGRDAADRDHDRWSRPIRW